MRAARKFFAMNENSPEVGAAVGRNFPVRRERRVRTGLWKAARASASRCDAGIEASRESRSSRLRVTWLSMASLASNVAAMSPDANAMHPFANAIAAGLAVRTADAIQSACPVHTQRAENSKAFESASPPLNPPFAASFVRQSSSSGAMSIPRQNRTDDRMR